MARKSKKFLFKLKELVDAADDLGKRADYKIAAVAAAMATTDYIVEHIKELALYFPLAYRDESDKLGAHFQENRAALYDFLTNKLDVNNSEKAEWVEGKAKNTFNIIRDYVSASVFLDSDTWEIDFNVSEVPDIFGKMTANIDVKLFDRYECRPYCFNSSFDNLKEEVLERISSEAERLLGLAKFKNKLDESFNGEQFDYAIDILRNDFPLKNTESFMDIFGQLENDGTIDYEYYIGCGKDNRTDLFDYFIPAGLAEMIGNETEMDERIKITDTGILYGLSMTMDKYASDVMVGEVFDIERANLVIDALERAGSISEATEQWIKESVETKFNNLPSPIRRAYIEGKRFGGTETIVFMQGDDADEAMTILADQGEEELLDYLTQWDMGEGGEIEDCAPDELAGDEDTILYHIDDRTHKIYVLNYNERIGYCGLSKLATESSYSNPVYILRENGTQNSRKVKA